MMNRFFEKNGNIFYLVFRVIVGVLFLLHGIQKLPGIFDGSTSVVSLMFLAALIETIGGILLIIGLFTRTVALISAVEMLVAYFMVHMPGGINPLQNKGELALLFFAAFLVLLAFGAKKWGIDSGRGH